ncbi:MAG: hypothetical protein DSO07_03505 [Thermoproteota archaeon]|jgi:predicted nucleotidyltransferase|uniref:Nucleotidyltransferase domain-containing protein n=2 Tax=Candidatus Methanodesulfokora washburnensis TaxID=2478471 RepID=A0A3R9X1C3_9CREN|nr:nucleotidyltransferase domain-containing protein [Candidatus Methanodesulfokores washburnensis]TDA41640.1 MAG: hypothetical protein DSO07_03505 [Candidatus Korarchaeota archaeon]
MHATNSRMDRTKLDEICHLVRKEVEKEGIKVKSIILFGSACRADDFVPGVSDVDLLVIADRPSRGYLEFYIDKSRVDAAVLTEESVKAVFEKGHPLSFMLKRGIVLYDDGTYRLIPKEVKITDITRKVLRRSAVVALGLAIEKYLQGSYLESVSHLYHSVRHLIRYKFSLRERAEDFPISDKEVLEKAENLKEVFLKLVKMRRELPERSNVRKAVDEVIDVVSSELKLRSAGLDEIERFREISALTACEDNGYLVFRIRSADGTFELREKEVRNVESILC